MDEKTGVDERRAGKKFVRFIDWLNHRLIPVIGPPDWGPYDAVLNCPAPHRPEPVHDEPINELGMPKRRK